MKKLKILFGTVILSAGLASCSSAYYASAGYASDDLYAVHDRAEISRRKQAEAEAQRVPQRPADAQRPETEGYFTAQVAAQRLQEEDAAPPVWTPPLPLDAAAAEGLQAGRPSSADGLDEGEWTVEPLWPEADLDQPTGAGEPTDEEPSCD